MDLERARALLRSAGYPDGIDPNYFYAEFLYEQEDYSAARDALLRAQNAPARASRPLADAGRHKEISALLREIDDKAGRG